ncbi:MAG: type IV pilus modification PilV family protein [Planctomycetota bacterium]|jgi:prepilin-type N-terminal cleavage/methylation domain-containing protein
MSSNYQNHKGFTLAEAMIATVVLGIAAAGVLLPFTSGATVRAEGTRMTLAARLAGDLMEEIVSRPFHDPDGTLYDYNPGPEAGENTFSDFDNVDDFDGYTEPQGQVKDASGIVFTDLNYAGFSRDVVCEYVYMPQESGNTGPKFVRVVVRVYYRGGEIATVSRLVSD